MSAYDAVTRALKDAGCKVTPIDPAALRHILGPGAGRGGNATPGATLLPEGLSAAVAGPSPSSVSTGNWRVAMTEAQAEAQMDLLPPGIKARLLGFQREGVRFLVQRGGRAMLADEPGLGKTVQALCAAACFPKSFPLLVVCPSSMRWVDVCKHCRTSGVASWAGQRDIHILHDCPIVRLASAHSCISSQGY